ncbi:MAG: porin, partial [Myxococcota bacterium]
LPYPEVDFDTRPEAHLVGNLVDTGDKPGKGVDKLGFEFAAVWDSLSVQSEFMPIWVEGTGYLDDDGYKPAKDLFFWGAYVQASWFLTGEHRNYDTNSGVFKRVKLKENFSLSQGTWGALELAARYSHLDLNDNGVDGGIQNDVTLGANWYLYSNLRLMLNWVHAQRAHSRVGDGGRADIVEGRISLDF